MARHSAGRLAFTRARMHGRLACTHSLAHIGTRMHAFTPSWVCTYARTFVRRYIHILVRMYVRACVRTYVLVLTDGSTDSVTDRCTTHTCMDAQHACTRALLQGGGRGFSSGSEQPMVSQPCQLPASMPRWVLLRRHACTHAARTRTQADTHAHSQAQADRHAGTRARGHAHTHARTHLRTHLRTHALAHTRPPARPPARRHARTHALLQGGGSGCSSSSGRPVDGLGSTAATRADLARVAACVPSHGRLARVRLPIALGLLRSRPPVLRVRELGLLSLGTHSLGRPRTDTCSTALTPMQLTCMCVCSCTHGHTARWSRLAAGPGDHAPHAHREDHRHGHGHGHAPRACTHRCTDACCTHLRWAGTSRCRVRHSAAARMLPAGVRANLCACGGACVRVCVHACVRPCA